LAGAIPDAQINGRRGRRARARKGALSEINVTPLVDVMLVLLIIFMISAPLLTVGVPVELPKTEAAAVNDQTEPLTLSIRRDGSIFVQETATPYADLEVQLKAMAGNGLDKPIYVRADGAAAYAVVAQVMAKLQSAGFTSINLITDTGVGAEATPAGAPAAAPIPTAPAADTGLRPATEATP
jgi:biopolymer transport protein TolR